MNLRGIANGLTRAVNPNTYVTWVQSTGYTIDATGTQIPTTTSKTIDAQIQGTTPSDLRHMDGLNIQGVMRSVFMYGSAMGAVRADQKGGDILQFPESRGGLVQNWMVVQVIETWPDWCHVIVTLQSA